MTKERPVVDAGFDYQRTVLELRVVKTYQQIAEFCGWASHSAVADVAAGRRIPSHPQGEALWILYLDLFGKKPPLNCPKADTLATT